MPNPTTAASREAAGPPVAPFPPHWFTVSRAGAVISFELMPCANMVSAVQWRLYDEGLRTVDVVEAVELLRTCPRIHTLVLAYVDTIDAAHYYMESGRMALGAWDGHARERAFGDPIDPPKPAGEASQAAEPLPAGHPDSYSMDDLRASLQLAHDDGHSPTVAARISTERAQVIHCPRCGTGDVNAEHSKECLQAAMDVIGRRLVGEG